MFSTSCPSLTLVFFCEDQSIKMYQEKEKTFEKTISLKKSPTPFFLEGWSKGLTLVMTWTLWIKGYKMLFLTATSVL